MPPLILNKDQFLKKEKEMKMKLIIHLLMRGAMVARRPQSPPPAAAPLGAHTHEGAPHARGPVGQCKKQEALYNIFYIH